MSIAYARLEYVKRKLGGNAVLKSCYNGRDSLFCDRTRKFFYFTHRDADLAHDEILLPPESPEGWEDPKILWNAAEHWEKRCDSQVAKELVLALPGEQAVSLNHKIAMAREFAEKYFVSERLGVQLDVH